MLVGQLNFNLSSDPSGVSGKAGASDAPMFDWNLLDNTAGDGDKARAAHSSQDGERDPIRAANEALAQEFLEWAEKSVEEKIRERVLDAKGLTEDELKALPKAERDAIEAEIREAVKLVFGVNDDGGAADTHKSADAAAI